MSARIVDWTHHFFFLKKIVRWLITQTFYRVAMSEVGSRTVLYRPTMVLGAGGMSLGSKVFIREGARLECVPVNGVESTIEIGDRVSIEQDLHAVSCGAIRIGARVTIAPRVSLIGSLHPIEESAVGRSYVERLSPDRQYITIKEGAFLGVGVTVLPGVVIGENSVVGAHSLVNRSIPDNAIAAGVPARVIKTYDKALGTWIKVPQTGP